MTYNAKKTISLLLSAAFALSGVLPIFAEGEIAKENTEITVTEQTEQPSEPVYEYKIAGLGEVYSATAQNLSPSAAYYNYLTDANGVKESAHIIIGDLSRGATVAGAELGSGFGKRGKVSSLKDDPESENRLIAAANADFFSTSTGVPMGVYVADGRYISSSDGLMGFGVHEDGRVVFGTVGDSVSIISGEGNYEVTYFNKYTTIYGAYLLNSDFGEKTRLASGISATEYIIAYEGEFLLGESIFGTVAEIRTSNESAEIPAGHAVLVVPDEFEKSELYKTIEVGDELEIKISVNDEFKGIVSAVGGGDVLLRGGEITDTLTDDPIETARNPRTAFGVTADGDFVIAVVDGRRSGYSSGVKLTALAEMMRDIGCTDAINLDGGGSSAIVSFVDGAKLLNKPSDNAERSVPNAIALYENREAASALHTLEFSCENPLLLCGVDIPLSLALKDSAGEVIPFEFNSENTVFTYDELFGKAEFTENGVVFTAGDFSGVGKITAEVDFDGEIITSDLFIKVTDSIDFLGLAENIIIADADAEKSVEILAMLGEKEVYFGDKASVLSSNADIISKVEGKNVILSMKTPELVEEGSDILPDFMEDEPFEYPEFAYGSITLSLGGREISVPVFFDNEISLDLGEFLAPYMSISNEGYTLSYIEDSGNFVIESPAPVEIPEETTEIFVDEIIEPTEEPEEAEEAEETTEETAEIPEEPTFEPFEVVIKAEDSIISRGLSDKCLWIWADGLNSDAMPYAEIEIDGAREILYYDRFYDFLDYNGKALYTLSFEGKEGIITLKTLFAYTTYSDEQKVLLSSPILAKELDTNLYSDMVGHWGEYYVNALSYMGIVSGSENLKGELVYIPDGNLSREQFAKILVNYLKIDIEKYSGEELNFADNEEIASWAVPYVKAAVGVGLMRGRSTPQDTVIFAPADKITRQEAIYVLGGLLPSISGEPLGFSDGDTVAPWARENLEKALAAGLISGYDDGTLRPDGSITRAEAATVVVRLYEFSQEN